MRVVSAVVLILGTASLASAQSAYVGASLIGDFVRVSGISGSGGGNGETFGGALRLGVPLGPQWGIELEFARTGTIDAVPGAILAGTSVSFGDPSPVIFPAPVIEAERRLSTITTAAWWSHLVSDRLSLVYLGGVAFTRVESELHVSYPIPTPFPRIPGVMPILPPRNFDQETVAYGADVSVGFEARVTMTDHLRLTPGIRMQTVAGGWAIRPGVGLQWAF